MKYIKHKSIRVCFLILGVLAGSLHAQTSWSYDFGMTSPEGPSYANDWESLDWTQTATGFGGNTPGAFRRYAWHGLANPNNSATDSTDYIRPLAGNNYQVKYAGGTVWNRPGQDWGGTAVHKTGYDLSAVNSSLTIRMGWAPFTTLNVGVGSTYTPTSDNQLFQIGLMNGSSGRFGDGVSDSLFVGGLEEQYRRVNIGNNQVRSSTDLDLNVYNEGAVVQTLSNNHNFFTKDIVIGGGAAGTDIYFYANTMSFKNVGGGNMEIDWGITRYRYDYFTMPINGNASSNVNIGETVSFANFSTTVAHGLGDLSDLHVGLGMHVEESDDISVSGANYDWYTTVVPEPSSALLSIMSGLLLFIRRR